MAPLPSLQAIREAQRLLASNLPVTTLVAAPGVAGSTVYFKLETELPTGSFKPRGALYALATEMRRRPVREVTAASTGNHGAAVAWAARQLSVPATIFLPQNPNPVKRRNIEQLGARIVEAGHADLAHAAREAALYSRAPETYFLNDATDPHVPAGAGTIGLEILSQLPDVACVYVPVGDSALIRGVAAALNGSSSGVRVVGVQAERAPAYYLSWQAGRSVPTPTCDTCADGLATRTPEPENVAALREVVDEMVLVSEEEMLAAMAFLYQSRGIRAEPAGAAATAALLKRGSEQKPSMPTAVLVTGSNASADICERAGIPLP